MQGGVHGQGGVALGHHDAVAVGVGGVVVDQHLAVQRGEQVGDAQRGADVAHAGAPRLLDHGGADRPGQVTPRLAAAGGGAHEPARPGTSGQATRVSSPTATNSSAVSAVRMLPPFTSNHVHWAHLPCPPEMPSTPLR